MTNYPNFFGIINEQSQERKLGLHTCGNSSAVEHRLAKAGVASSNLVFRSSFVHSSIAQQVEQSAVNRSVVGSSPTRGANLLSVSILSYPLAQLAEHLTFNQGVPRSSRGWVTIYYYIV